MTEIETLIHELTSMGQSFHSYAQLVLNQSMTLNRKKLSEICGRCAGNCLKIRNLLIEKYNKEE